MCQNSQQFQGVFDNVMSLGYPSVCLQGTTPTNSIPPNLVDIETSIQGRAIRLARGLVDSPLAHPERGVWSLPDCNGVANVDNVNTKLARINKDITEKMSQQNENRRLDSTLLIDGGVQAESSARIPLGQNSRIIS